MLIVKGKDPLLKARIDQIINNKQSRSEIINK